eukprot:GHVU01102794.1.p1 GENE.GHVU01102794.1~~GHVU01102794.1.p1  ORF type:complete len:125 (-),score=0.06 GHVU01102794.1:73-447(-)
MHVSKLERVSGGAATRVVAELGISYSSIHPPVRPFTYPFTYPSIYLPIHRSMTNRRRMSRGDWIGFREALPSWAITPSIRPSPLSSPSALASLLHKLTTGLPPPDRLSSLIHSAAEYFNDSVIH